MSQPRQTTGRVQARQKTPERKGRRKERSKDTGSKRWFSGPSKRYMGDRRKRGGVWEKGKRENRELNRNYWAKEVVGEKRSIVETKTRGGEKGGVMNGKSEILSHVTKDNPNKQEKRRSGEQCRGSTLGEKRRKKEREGSWPTNASRGKPSARKTCSTPIFSGINRKISSQQRKKIRYGRKE